MKRIFKKLVTPLIINGFHYLWWQSKNTWAKNKYLGYEILQCPLDLQLYQEIIFKEKPEFVLQTGVCGGGSIVYFTSILDMMRITEEVKVIGIDIQLSQAAKEIDHPRVVLIEGSSTNKSVIQQIEKITYGKRGIVILDSDHSMKHVRQELDIYKEFVKAGCRLIVEDTNLNGHPVFRKFGPGPYEAVIDFLAKNKDFVADDKIWKRNLFSFHQNGWLIRNN